MSARRSASSPEADAAYPAIAAATNSKDRPSLPLVAKKARTVRGVREHAAFAVTSSARLLRCRLLDMRPR